MAPKAIPLATALLLALRAVAATHYGGACAGDEVTGEVQGQTGVVCGPKCNDGNFECPVDVPDGTSAQPQCMLQDVDQTAYCGLLCQVDTQCPSGASCMKVSGNIELSICIHPLSFSEWAKTGTRRKLTVGWPSKAGQAAPVTRGFQIAKAYSALQSLKRRYGIADGDADVLVFKELLSATTSAGLATARSPQSLGAGASLLPAALALGLGAAPSPPHSNPASASVLDPLKHDLSYLAGNLERGLPGLEQEIHDTVWNVEHLNKEGVATMLLRGVFIAAAVYLVVGSAYKNQTMGARGVDMIPHVSFWAEYPSLVVDGLKYATGMAGGLLGKAPYRGGAPGGFMPLGGVSERDTFNHPF